MGDNTLLEQSLSNPIRKIGTPDNTKELIGTLVTVFRMIPRETISEVIARGVSINNGMSTMNPELELIFSDAAKVHGNKADRTKCIFAFPRDPRNESLGLPYNPKKDALIKMQIDPNGVIVADGNKYTIAAEDFRQGDRDSAIDLANSYYDEAMTLHEYLAEHHGQEDDRSDFTLPEVLIPTDVPRYRTEVID